MKTKKEKLEYQKRYRQEHKEQIREQNRAYRESHPELNKQSQDKYKKNNSEKLLKRQRDYYEKNKDVISDRSLQWYEDNKNTPEFKKQRKEYNVKNKLKTLYSRAQKRAADKGRVFSITMEDIEVLFSEQNNQCAISGIKFDEYNQYYSSSLDRINSKLGYTKDNIQLVCSIVNTMKSDMSMPEFLKVIQQIQNRTNGHI